MAGGNPFEIYNIAGFKLPRYKVALYMIGIWVGGVTTIVQLNKLKPKAPITFESKEQEDFVKKYVEHTEKESHKPVLLRKFYAHQ